MPTLSDPGGDPAAGPPGRRWFELFAGPGPRLHPPPEHPREFPAWQRQIRGAVRRRGGVGPSDVRGAEAIALTSVTDGDLIRAEYLLRAGSVHRRGPGEFRATIVRPAAPEGQRPAVVICPGRNAIVGQVTGAQPPDYPDRNVAVRFAAAGFVTLTLDYGLSGRVDPDRVYGRDEAAVLAQLYLAAGTSLLAELAGSAAAAVCWLDTQPLVRPGRVALFGHSLGGAVALHAALFLDRPPPLCVASHLGSYAILGYGHPALLLPGIAADADLPDLYAALAPTPLHLQYGLADHELDPGDAAIAGQRITELYRLASAERRAQVRAFEMGHGTAAGPAIDFLTRALAAKPDESPANGENTGGREAGGREAGVTAAGRGAVVPLLRRGGWHESLDVAAAAAPGLPAVSLAPEILIRRDARWLREQPATLVPPPAQRRAIVSRALALFSRGVVRCGGLGRLDADQFRSALWQGAGLPPALTGRWCELLTAEARLTAEVGQVAEPGRAVGDSQAAGAGRAAGDSQAPGAGRLVGDSQAAGRPVTGLAPGAAGLGGGPAPGCAVTGAGAAGRWPALTLVALPGNTFTCLESVIEAVLAGSAVWVRPSTREPLSALRLAGALLDAGWPAELLGCYPTRRDLLRVLVSVTDRQIVYGGADVCAQLTGTATATVRGPMRVGAIVASDADPAAAAAQLLPLVAGDGGRFCTTVRAILCLDEPAGIAAHLAAALDAIAAPSASQELTGPGQSAGPADPADPALSAGLVLAASPDPELARRIAAAVADRLGPADRLVTQRPVLSQAGPLTYLAPALIRLAPRARLAWGDPALLGFEAPFPLATITQVSAAQAEALAAGADLVRRLPSGGSALPGLEPLAAVAGRPG